MTKFSDVPAAGITIRESANDGSDFTTNTAADYRRLFLGEDGLLHLKDSAGTVTTIGGSGITADAAWAAKGDLIVGTANDTAAILTAGTNGKVLMAASGEATGLKWETPAAGGASVPNIVQIVAAGNQTASFTIAAAASGNRLILLTNATVGYVTDVACTNVTWTEVKKATDATGYVTIWIGVVAGGSSGTTVTTTRAATYNTVLLYEVTDALTPTLGVSSASLVNHGNGNASIQRTASPTAGRLVVFAGWSANTTVQVWAFPGLPYSGSVSAVGNCMALAYATASALTVSVGAVSNIITAEVY